MQEFCLQKIAIWNCFPELSFEHWDVKSAFTNAPIEETIYVHQVPGFERQGSEGKVLLLKKALYGTKQAARAWQVFLSKIFLDLGATIHLKDDCVYIFRDGDAFLIIGTHVDDIFSLFNSKGKALRDKVMGVLRSKMEIEDKGKLSFALDIRIQRNVQEGIVKLSQRQYIEGLIKDYNITGVRTSPAPVDDLTEEDLPKTDTEKEEASKIPIRILIGRLWWLSQRDQIFFAV